MWVGGRMMNLWIVFSIPHGLSYSRDGIEVQPCGGPVSPAQVVAHLIWKRLRNGHEAHIDDLRFLNHSDVFDKLPPYHRVALEVARLVEIVVVVKAPCLATDDTSTVVVHYGGLDGALLPLDWNARREVEAQTYEDIGILLGGAVGKGSEIVLCGG